MERLGEGLTKVVRLSGRAIIGRRRGSRLKREEHMVAYQSERLEWFCSKKKHVFYRCQE